MVSTYFPQAIPEGVISVLWLVLFLLLTLVIAGGIVLYVAYPHRGEEMPVVPGVGNTMRQVRQAIPLVDEDQMNERRASLTRR